MSVVYDAAVLVAADRDDRDAWADRRIRLEFGEVGALLGRAGTHDVVDAHLVIVAAQTVSTVLTSDVGDLQLLSSVSGVTG